jgi:hypothetical protein
MFGLEAELAVAVEHRGFQTPRKKSLPRTGNPDPGVYDGWRRRAIPFLVAIGGSRKSRLTVSEFPSALRAPVLSSVALSAICLALSRRTIG